jgi:hypothetical protein
MSENIPTNQQAHNLCRQLEQCLAANPGGRFNPEALRDMRSAGLQLMKTSGLFEEKVGSLLIWANILYSPRKHARWDTPYQSGAEAIAHFMRCDLSSIKTIAWRMDQSIR